MTIPENSLGVGRLASVAWTAFQGVGLSSESATTVRQDIDTARHIADSLLASIKSAINRGASAFSLGELQQLGELSPLPSGGDSAEDWAAFIARALSNDQSASEVADLNAWQRIASDLQRYAAREASKLDPSGGAETGGGVTHANGQWYANGQALSLLDLFTAVRVNQAANYDDSIDGYVGEMQQNQRLLNAARAWASFLRNHKPGPPDGNNTPKATLSQADVDDFKAEWNVDPIATFTPSAATQIGTEQAQTMWQKWLEELKSFIDQKDTDNQILKGQIDQKYNRRSEVMEAMSSFAGKESKTGSQMASSLG